MAFRLGMIVFRKTICSSSTSASARSAPARPRRSPPRQLAGEGGNGTQVHVVLTPDDENALAGVMIGVRMLQDVEQVATLDVENDVLESDAALFPEVRVFRLVPREVLHYSQDSMDVCLLGTHRHRSKCA